MAAITSANVTVERQWTTTDGTGGVVEVTKDLAIALTAQGATIGDIPASALGLSKIYSVQVHGANLGGIVKAAGMSRAYDGSELVPFDLLQATDANRGDRANITGTVYVRVSGSGRT
jgi:hypothetical protein